MARQRSILLFLLLAVLAVAFPPAFHGQKTPDLERLFKDASKRKGKLPVIIIPGILGSELVNQRTGEKVWFKLGRSKDDDIRLPIGLDLEKARDDLVPGDVLRKLNIPILSDIEVYQKLIESLEKYGGFTAGSWDDPGDDLSDKYFLFPYDWRRDNVETARILFRKVEKLKADSNSPDRKFNVIAHSMGGLVARYAAMYGDRDLPSGVPVPDWAGDRHFSKIFLFGTPNEGSADALQVLLEGFGAIRNINLPFVRDVSPLDVITMPAAFELLPSEGTLQVYDEKLEPIDIDIYDPATWKKYNWSFYGEKDLLDEFSEAEVGRLEQYLGIVLARSRQFHRALGTNSDARSSLAFFMIGSDCIPTLDGLVIYKDGKKDRWVTLSRPESFRRSDGAKVSSDTLESLMLKPGDGRVTRRSLLADTLDGSQKQSVLFNSALPLTNALFMCEEHDKLTGNKTIQDNILTALISEATN